MQPLKFKHPIFSTLFEQHKEILLVVAKIKKQQIELIKIYPIQAEIKKVYLLEFYYNFLVKHLENEEKKLFPELREYLKPSKEILNKLIKQHQDIHQNITIIENTPSKDLPPVLKKFALELEKHIKIEERILFTFCDNIIPENVLNRIWLHFPK